MNVFQMAGAAGALLLGAWATPASPANDLDSDRDGLSDFHEVHKYGTDPKKADSDGDGTPDGDWLERREYAYTVRAVVQVMKPVTLEYLDDDFQDARLLDETEQYAELEVILYPFSTAHREIGADKGWRRPARELKRWLEPGPSSDCTPQLRRQVLAALAEEDIELDELSDREAVEQVSAWLMQRSEFHDGFASFITAFDERGRPYVPAELEASAELNQKEHGLTLEEQWQREVLASGMFEQRTHGSCTSSAIYLSGCLRAAGIPTRTVLCIPLVDANDAAERAMLERLQHNQVRRIASAAARSQINSWTSHTFNEVWVDGRWRRLNYSRLGQDILDRQCLGLMIHVGSFHDWADARMSETVGRRQKLDLYDDVFGGPNPYSTIALRDAFGEHCTLANPEPGEQRVSVERLHWTDDGELPADILANCAERGRFGLIARLSGAEDGGWLKDFLSSADLRVFLDADGHPRLSTSLDPGCWWFKGDVAYVYLPFGQGDRADLVRGVEYSATARNQNAGFHIELELKQTRP